ncbi:hypothetical protein D018_3718A, partial [Vibrio parahaemolyticus VP2007-007]
MRYE